MGVAFTRLVVTSFLDTGNHIYLLHKEIKFLLVMLLFSVILLLLLLTLSLYQDIAGTLATEIAEDSAQVAKLRSALESVDHKRRKVVNGRKLFIFYSIFLHICVFSFYFRNFWFEVNCLVFENTNFFTRIKACLLFHCLSH